MEFRTLDVPTEDGHTLKLGAYHGNADVSILWEDPLRTRMVTSRFLFEVFRMQRFVRRNITRLRSPLLGLLAGEDTLVDNGATLEILRHVEGTPVRIENYREAHHVLTGSLPLEELVGRIWHWFTAPEASLERTVVIEEIQDLPSPNGASAMNFGADRGDRGDPGPAEPERRERHELRSRRCKQQPTSSSAGPRS